MSASAGSTAEKRDYNEHAIRTAEKLTAARKAAAKRAWESSPPPAREDLFHDGNRSGLGVALEYEAMGNQPVSDDLQSRADAFGYRFEHLGTTIGTIIHDIDLKSDLSEEQVKFIRDTLLERKIIGFRDQHMSEEQQVNFGRMFGDLDAFPFGPPGDNPYILEIRHGKQSPGTENSWHTDVTWMEEPSLGSIAQCIKVPPHGGDTLFSDSHACYQGLPPALRERLPYLHGINDYRVFMGGGLRSQLPDELVDQIKQDIPFGVDHPLCRTHPETGKPSLFIHGGFLRHESLYDTRKGEALPEDESRDIVRLLLLQHNRPEYICRFQWEEGSVAFWDNRAVQHYAASDYFPHARVLRRVTCLLYTSPSPRD